MKIVELTKVSDAGVDGLVSAINLCNKNTGFLEFIDQRIELVSKELEASKNRIEVLMSYPEMNIAEIRKHKHEAAMSLGRLEELGIIRSKFEEMLNPNK